MTNEEITTILTPIRYPLTDESARTLAAAGQIAQEQNPAELQVVHVNLVQRNEDLQTKEFTNAISSTLDGVEASVTTRQGILVEQIILEEIEQTGADIVVVGANGRGKFRKFLSRVTGNGLDVRTFLEENLAESIQVKEVNSDPESPLPSL